MSSGWLLGCGACLSRARALLLGTAAQTSLVLDPHCGVLDLEYFVYENVVVRSASSSGGGLERPQHTARRFLALYRVITSEGCPRLSAVLEVKLPFWLLPTECPACRASRLHQHTRPNRLPPFASELHICFEDFVLLLPRQRHSVVHASSALIWGSYYFTTAGIF